MSDLTRDDVREMLEELMKKTEPPNEWFRDGYRVVTVDELEMSIETAIKHIKRALEVPNRDGFALVDDEALITALKNLEAINEPDEEWYNWRDEQEYEDRWERRTDERINE